MSLQHLSNQDLHLRMEKLVRTERKITHLVLLHIAEIEERRLYADLGFDGMYSYLTKAHGYSDGAAYRRLQSARLLKQVPEVAQKIEEGCLNLTQLTQVQKGLKERVQKNDAVSIQKTLDVLSQIENKDSFETQKTLALELNLPIKTHEKLKPQQDHSVRLEITLSPEQYADLKKAKSLLSHICPDGSWAEVIGVLAAKFNKQKLGVNKISSIGEGHSTQSVVATKVRSDLKSSRKPYRAYISIHKKRELLNRSQNCCEYRDPKSGQKCTSNYQLQIEHIRPLALAGTDDIKNLRILCRAHNDLMARRAGLSG